MPALLQLDVIPEYGQVAIVDATWQDYPQWDRGDEWVAFRAPSLSHPESPPYPGVAVATQPDYGPDGELTSVHIEVWSDDEPTGLHCVHETVLSVGSHGVDVGNQIGGGLERLRLARGLYPLRVLVNAEVTREVSRVVFALGQHKERPPLPA